MTDSYWYDLQCVIGVTKEVLLMLLKCCMSVTIRLLLVLPEEVLLVCMEGCYCSGW